jgi:endonuclease/exonuclease/phosphatase family metal-dependent hydrolase
VLVLSIAVLGLVIDDLRRHPAHRLRVRARARSLTPEGFLGVLGLLLLCSGCGSDGRNQAPPENLLLPCSAPDCLRVLSWNLHGLPFYSNTPERLRRVAAVIAIQQPDLVLLQEVWLRRYTDLLRAALEADYDMLYQPRRVTQWPRGGLLVFVRRSSTWRAEAPRFVAYEVSAPWYRVTEGDGISGKGILATRIAHAGASLVVVDTHLQSGYAGRDYRTVRGAQIEQLQAFLQHEHPSEPVLIGGDFNTTSVEPLYASLLTALGTDLTAAERWNCHCGTNFDAGQRQWIDYVFARSWNVNSTTQRITNDAPDSPYSDHDGVLVRVVYNAASLRATDGGK